MAKTPQKKGNFIVLNAAGKVQFAALAELTNDTPSMGWRDVTAITVHNDSSGVPRTWTKNFQCLELTVKVTPGVGSALADKAAVLAAVASIRKGMAWVSSSYDLPELNCAAGDKAVIEEVSGNQNEGQIASFDLTIRKYLEFNVDGTTTAIDFTGAWASIN